ncbi:hypothetical protein SAMN05216429_102280 [Marinobacter persicus]|uniref:Uncharacterized protein n=1 Tax=Marinobacter persicus TaxID=930118 RepID=A0A1I3R719_9GAMM|nr:hypothetical protein [Marinobacter persicus]GHD43669.1 hypothetical protein GCM10008110_07880 [Marinobacter persicus]SFJ42118.1 hypothetical protein SAMN05216429_102280 [Marinobacter persicus]
MNTSVIRAGIVALALAVLAGCASRQYQATTVVAVQESACQQTFRQWQAMVEAGNHFDAQTWSPPGFPYLRVNRLLASFQVARLDSAQRQEWLKRAQQLALTAWQYEAESLGGTAEQRLPALQRCARLAAETLMEQEDAWAQLQQAMQIPDDYNNVGRALGAYPLVAPVVRWRAGVVMGELMDEFGHDQPEAPLAIYLPRAGTTELDRFVVRSAQARSELGIPVFTPAEREALVARYAPAWVVETASKDDIPGRPGRSANGALDFRPEPVVFSQMVFTRFQGDVLPQLVYTLWFPRRPAESRFDIVAGELDGLVWRVTLGADGQPLIYDSIHPCGCYHTWVLAPGGLRPKGEPGFWEEPLWIAGIAPEADGGVVLHVSAGSHYLMNVTADVPETKLVPQRYGLEPYNNLRGPSRAGQRLFDESGMIPGTERSERFFLWPTGVPSPGAMRQWGSHATAFVGTRHFDDAWLLQEYFRKAE